MAKPGKKPDSDPTKKKNDKDSPKKKRRKHKWNHASSKKEVDALKAMRKNKKEKDNLINKNTKSHEKNS